GLARDEGRDLPQGRLFGDELPNVLFCPLEHLDRGRLSVARCDSAEEVRLALTDCGRHGDRPVVQTDLATTLGDVERLRVRWLGAREYIAVMSHEEIGAPRHEIAVATSQPSVLIAPDLQEALLDRPRGGGHQLQTPWVRSLPEAREVDQSDCLA